MSRVLLIGNDINNINNSKSWEDLLHRIVKICGNNFDIDINKAKPFPLLYEEIYLKAIRSGIIDEKTLKSKIAEIICNIEPNEIHKELISINCDNYITTNYDYSLEKVLVNGDLRKELSNIGIRKESKYSLYRHNRIGNKKFWHIHGEVNIPNSITLGFEHYGGQLQQYRDYTITGTHYKGAFKNRQPLHQQLTKGNTFENSWINFLYQNEVHILGLKLGYEETDLWWLLASRARFIHESSFLNKSKIIYYCPSVYKDPYKTEIMEACNIKTVFLDFEGLDFYKNVIKKINKG